MSNVNGWRCSRCGHEFVTNFCFDCFDIHRPLESLCCHTCCNTKKCHRHINDILLQLKWHSPGPTDLVCHYTGSHQRLQFYSIPQARYMKTYLTGRKHELVEVAIQSSIGRRHAFKCPFCVSEKGFGDILHYFTEPSHDDDYVFDGTVFNTCQACYPTAWWGFYNRCLDDEETRILLQSPIIITHGESNGSVCCIIN